ncbi:hypothetical protein SAMD00023353_1002130 [Rosellinia necatrix]|uniref:Uncharacterized protein n=1 Tax=Rosellinia necatrix TaxID=77044 RepID=A0A1W2TBL6_ROSNE|nr:hypothetical protein SAMD00023353_1002130 [Rosellinia necatrix]
MAWPLEDNSQPTPATIRSSLLSLRNEFGINIPILVRNPPSDSGEVSDRSGLHGVRGDPSDTERNRVALSSEDCSKIFNNSFVDKYDSSLLLILAYWIDLTTALKDWGKYFRATPHHFPNALQLVIDLLWRCYELINCRLAMSSHISLRQIKIRPGWKFAEANLPLTDVAIARMVSVYLIQRGFEKWLDSLLDSSKEEYVNRRSSYVFNTDTMDIEWVTRDSESGEKHTNFRSWLPIIELFPDSDLLQKQQMESVDAGNTFGDIAHAQGVGDDMGMGSRGSGSEGGPRPEASSSEEFDSEEPNKHISCSGGWESDGSEKTLVASTSDIEERIITDGGDDETFSKDISMSLPRIDNTNDERITKLIAEAKALQAELGQLRAKMAMTYESYRADRII